MTAVTAVAQPLKQLLHLLAPQGLLEEAQASEVLRPYFDTRYGSHDPATVLAQWQRTLEGIPSAKVIVLGVPMDLGSIDAQGQRFGPHFVRRYLAETASAQGTIPQLLEQHRVLDIGDVQNWPGGLMDEDLAPGESATTRWTRWGKAGEELDLPVTPLSMLERSLRCLSALNPDARVLSIGGDHSLSYIPIKVLQQGYPGKIGILHLDAHPDTATYESRMLNYATWAGFVNEEVGGNGRLQQVGVRVAAGESPQELRDRLGIWQHPAWLANTTPPETVVAEIAAHWQAIGVERVYVTLDIDVLDPHYAAATGAFVWGGLLPTTVQRYLRLIGQRFPVAGADLVEVNPLYHRGVPGEPGRTLQSASFLLWEEIAALLAFPKGLTNPWTAPERAPDSIVNILG